MKKSSLTAPLVFTSLAALVQFSFISSLPAADLEGKALVSRHACKNCHMIEDDGSLIAPPLDGISKHQTSKYIVSVLMQSPGKEKTDRTEPSSRMPPQLMPHLGLKQEEAESIASFLMSLPDAKLICGPHKGADLADKIVPGSHFVPAASSPESKKGWATFREKGCIACHKVESGKGGNLGPDLNGVGARRSRAFIISRIDGGALFLPKPGEGSGKISMPAVKLSSREKGELLAYLLTLEAEKEKN